MCTCKIKKITKLDKSHLLVKINICIKFCDNTSFNCKDTLDSIVHTASFSNRTFNLFSNCIIDGDESEKIHSTLYPSLIVEGHYRPISLLSEVINSLPRELLTYSAIHMSTVYSLKS